MISETSSSLGMEEREKVEKDTDDIEDISNVLEFLLPLGSVPADCDNFGVLYNKRALEGWVKQPSACCGAASVAGAWNTLAGLHRRDTSALNHEIVLSVYRNMFVQMIDNKQRSFERRLGAPIHDLLRGISAGLMSLGRTIGGRKETGVQLKAVIAVLKNMARDFIKSRCLTVKLLPSAENALSNSLPSDNASSSLSEATTTGNAAGSGLRAVESLLSAESQQSAPVPPLDAAQRFCTLARSDIECIFELFQSDGVDLNVTDVAAAESLASVTVIGASVAPEVDVQGLRLPVGADGLPIADVPEDEEDEEEEEDDTVLASAATAAASKKKNNAWDWKKELLNILKNIAGLKRLSASRPSTAAIGNWGILQCFRLMADTHSQPIIGDGVKCKLFMGKKSLGSSKAVKLPVSVSAKDDTEEIAQQWSTLRAAFARQDTVLLFHLKNHYALIFALREWTNARTGECVRQMLTARKGQRPTAWIDFSEARETVLGWAGYKIMACTRSVPQEVLASSQQMPPNEEDLVKFYTDL